jgi:flagellar hook assembly protein FlgD
LIRLNTNYENTVPSSFKLYENHPNPFNPSTKISFELSNDDIIELNVYDLTGNLIKNITSQNYTAGRHSLNWNGTDNYNNPVPSGVYIYQIKTSDNSESKKMMLLK